MYVEACTRMRRSKHKTRRMARWKFMENIINRSYKAVRSTPPPYMHCTCVYTRGRERNGSSRHTHTHTHTHTSARRVVCLLFFARAKACYSGPGAPELQKAETGDFTRWHVAYTCFAQVMFTRDCSACTMTRESAGGKSREIGWNSFLLKVR